MKKVTFINLEMSSVAHAQCRRELPAYDSAWELVNEMMIAGYKVSMQIDQNTGNASCYVTDKMDVSANKGCCMGAWAGTPESAIEKVAIALHYALQNGTTWLETREYFSGRAGADAEEFEQFLAWQASQNKHKGT